MYVKLDVRNETAVLMHHDSWVRGPLMFLLMHSAALFFDKASIYSVIVNLGYVISTFTSTVIFALYFI